MGETTLVRVSVVIRKVPVREYRALGISRSDYRIVEGNDYFIHRNVENAHVYKVRNISNSMFTI